MESVVFQVNRLFGDHALSPCYLILSLIFCNGYVVCRYLESLYFYHMFPPRQLLLLLHLEVITGKCSQTWNCCCLSFLGLCSSLCFSTKRPKLSIEKGALNETS